MGLDTTALYSYILSLITVLIIMFLLKLYKNYQASRCERKIVDISLLPTGAVTFDAIVNEFLNLKEISCAIQN